METNTTSSLIDIWPEESFRTRMIALVEQCDSNERRIIEEFVLRVRRESFFAWLHGVVIKEQDFARIVKEMFPWCESIDKNLFLDENS